MTSKPVGDARRVVTGLDQRGRSTVVDDGIPSARLTRPGGATVTEIWRADELPASLDDARPIAAEAVLSPAAQGLAVRVCTFPPESNMDAATHQSYAASVAQSYGTSGVEKTHLHSTNTVDVVTVISGELCVITETGETVLRQGESVVQRGTNHAWSNRTNQTTTVVALMMAASPDNGLLTPESASQQPE